MTRLALAAALLTSACVPPRGGRHGRHGHGDTAEDSAPPCVEEAWYPDADGDGWGDADDAVTSCTPPAGRVAVAGDCDDADAAVSPDADERCADGDQDCDGDDDAGAVDMGAWYLDGDGDGFGAGEALVACDAPVAYVATEGDCDDGDASTFPGAAEVCDGVDNDCGDPDEGETGVATFFGDDGAVEDWSARLAAGAAGAPVAAAFDRDGTLAVCAGTWYVAIDLSARDFAIDGIAGADATILSGGGVAPVVAIDAEGAAVSIAGLTLRDGAADDGGAVQTGHGGVALSLAETRVVDNVADGYGGGIRVYEGSLSLVDVVFTGNRAGSYGGAVAAYEADVTCAASSWSDAGLESNMADGGGGVWFWTAGWETLVSTGCDWTGNTPDDVYVGPLGSGTAYAWGQDATFTCDRFGC